MPDIVSEFPTISLTAAKAGIYIARELGLDKPLSDQRVWHLARLGVLPCVRVGRRVYFRVHEIDAWLTSGGARIRREISPNTVPVFRIGQFDD